MKINMNSLELERFLFSICRSDFDRQIVVAIMSAYMQISGFYPEHAIKALKIFQDRSVLILNVNELNNKAIA
jgi:hypothetical protein